MTIVFNPSPELEEIQTLLQKFEAKYNIESRSFHQQFQAGTLGDAANFFEWNTYYEMLNELHVSI